MLLCSFHLWTNFKINAVRPSQFWAFSPLHISCCKLTYFATPKSWKEAKIPIPDSSMPKRRGNVTKYAYNYSAGHQSQKIPENQTISTQTRKQNVINKTRWEQNLDSSAQVGHIHVAYQTFVNVSMEFEILSVAKLVQMLSHSRSFHAMHPCKSLFGVTP